MKKVFFLALLLSAVFQVKAQQIGNGLTAIIDNFNVPLLSGIYQTDQLQEGYPTDAGSYRYLMVMRNHNLNNNYQFQIASSYAENDRMYFRKIASTTLTNKNTAWYEIATRGSNTFTGIQTFNGSIKGNALGGSVKIQNDNGYLEIGPRNTNCAHYVTDRTYHWFNKPVILGDGVLRSDTGNLYLRTASTPNRLTILKSNGYVGIGTSNPQNLLDVYGTIRAKEVKIEVSGWPDYVFDSNYSLPGLQTVSEHIEANKHLPGIPSAAEVAENGVSIGEMQAKLLQKVEELTLYLIRQENTIQELRTKIEQLENK
ncbi:hypothetical protein AGMMS50262_19240 [Bacteroidia bacterium]|nr:hypothetical protein AGMMS50262_19240 [Bacteroidia bacterium]